MLKWEEDVASYLAMTHLGNERAEKSPLGDLGAKKEDSSIFYFSLLNI